MFQKQRTRGTSIFREIGVLGFRFRSRGTSISFQIGSWDFGV